MHWQAFLKTGKKLLNQTNIMLGTQDCSHSFVFDHTNLLNGIKVSYQPAARVAKWPIFHC